MLDLLILAIAPAVFIFLYVYARDRYDREPLHLVLWVFLLGALSVIPIALVELPFVDSPFSSSIVAPVVEEAGKFIVVYLFIFRHREFNEPVDGIIYAMAAALGFAMIENIFYVIEGGVVVGFMRALLSVPGHVIFSCIWGAALGIAKFRPECERVKIILAGLIGAMVLHGIFNFSIETLGAGGLLVILVLVVTGIWWTLRNIEKAHADPASVRSAKRQMAAEARAGSVPLQSPVVYPDSTCRDTGDVSLKFCTGCGTPLREGMAFCENCGKRV